LAGEPHLESRDDRSGSVEPAIHRLHENSFGARVRSARHRVSKNQRPTNVTVVVFAGPATQATTAAAHYPPESTNKLPILEFGLGPFRLLEPPSITVNKRSDIGNWKLQRN
jgi:hypothetical protein